MKFTFIAMMLIFSRLSFAGAPIPAPVVVDQKSYMEWLGQIGSATSAFSDNLFSWYNAQLTKDMPGETLADPEKVFVSIDQPLKETIELEDSGDIERGATFGMEIYTLLDAPINIALDTLLFKWGKPIGGREGITYPIDSIFGKRSEKLEEIYGTDGYKNTSSKSQGGIAKEVNDIYVLVVRGDAQKGYLVLGNYFGPNGTTTTKNSMSFVYLKPTADGKTEFRLSARHLGQSYLMFGIDFGRKNFGFNRDRIRQGQKEYVANVMELKNTGKIVERPAAN